MPSSPNRPSRLAPCAALAATLAAAAIPAHARILAFGAYPSNYSANTPVLVPLMSDGGVSLPFSTFSRNQKVIITFSAECGNGATNFTTLTDIDIQVDGVAINPTDYNLNGFCTSNGTINADVVMASITLVAVVPRAGTHIVGVLARSSDSSSFWYLNRAVTVVHD